MTAPYGKITRDEVRALQAVRPMARYLYTALTTFRNGSGEAWPSRAVMAELTGLAAGTVSNLLGELVKAGLLVRVQTGPHRWDTRWPAITAPVKPDESGLTQVVNPGFTEAVNAMEQTTRTRRSEGLPPFTSAASLSPMPRPNPTPGQITLTGEVVEHHDPASEVRQAWASTYAESHGKQPPKALMDRVCGKVREIARTDPGLDEWREWYRAACRAGRSGTWDVVGCYQPRRPEAQQRSKTGDALRLAAAMRERERDGHDAFGMLGATNPGSLLRADAPAGITRGAGA